MMISLLKKSSIVVAALALAGCEERQAGDVSSAQFGSAVATNQLAQSINLSASLLADLQGKFRAASPDMINFAFNESTLDAEARGILDRQAAWIKANPAIKFRVYGHTDLVGSNAYNERLGHRRARAAVNYLVAQGVRRGQVEAVSSLGETRPLVNTPNRERLNRRTVTEIVGLDRRFGKFDFDGKVANRIYAQYVAGDEEN